METNFKSVHTPKDIIISTIVILAGVGSYFLNPTLGVTLASCGLLMLCFFKKGYKADGKEQVLTKVAMDMSASYLQPLKDFLGGKSIDLNLGEASKGGPVRLEVYFNQAAELAYAQLYTFSNYTYEPAVGTIELHSKQAEKLISMLKK